MVSEVETGDDKKITEKSVGWWIWGTITTHRLGMIILGKLWLIREIIPKLVALIQVGEIL